MARLRINKKPLVSIGIWFGLLGFLLLTNPHRLPQVVLIVPFTLIFFGIFLPLRWVTGRWFGKNEKLGKSASFLLSASLALLPTLILVLSSINQLTWPDFILLGLIIIGLGWYISRTKLSYHL